MMSNLLVRLFGWRAALHHGDPLVWDRWRWLRTRLRRTHNNDRVLDVGCGTGAFTIGAASLGYRSLGLSWDERNQNVAEARARLCGFTEALFEICDVRNLHERHDLIGKFDVVLCTENIEHIIDDFRLIASIAGCLKPGGRLLLTTPYLRRIPWSIMDWGPFPETEDGSHVRRGYNKAMLAELCEDAGLRIEEFSFVSGPLSQVGAVVLATLSKIHPVVGWIAVLPLRPLPPLFDGFLTWFCGTTHFCIGIEAYKPRRLVMEVAHQ